jgi:Notch-like protein
LFLAAREGSFNTCRLLLDHMANRDIADHMDRLPRDIAAERLHHDIVRLLDEHIPRPSAVQNLQQQQQTNNLSNMNNNVNSPPSQVMADNFNAGSHNASGTPQPKPKKRTIKPEQYSMGDTDKLPKPPRRPSNRKKKSSDSLLHGGVINQAMDTSPMSSESNTMSPPDMQMMHNNMFNVPVNSMAISQPNLSSLVEPHNNVHNNYGTLQINKAPPPYEDCFNNKAVSFHNLHFANNSYMANVNNANMLGGSQQQQQQQSQQYLQQTSPFPSPQSTASQFTALSPSTMSYVGSPPQVTSPSKRPSLPTSPTHMAALRAATQQKLLSASTNNAFDYSPNGANLTSNTNQFYSSNTISHYPTPPSQHSDSSSSSPQHTHGPDSYPTPSPESPGQWSSSSPHSTSDWSEGIHSPPGAAQVMYNPQMQVQHPHNSSRGTEGIYI